LQISCPARPDSNHGDSVTDGSSSENPQSGDMLDFNRLGRGLERI